MDVKDFYGFMKVSIHKKRNNNDKKYRITPTITYGYFFRLPNFKYAVRLGHSNTHLYPSLSSGSGLILNDEC